MLTKVGDWKLRNSRCNPTSISSKCSNHIRWVISSAAALVASKLNPLTIEYMITSHCSEEKELVALGEMGLEPRLFFNMRLGEGTGASLMFPIVEAAIKVADEMATFENSGVSTGEFKTK